MTIYSTLIRLLVRETVYKTKKPLLSKAGVSEGGIICSIVMYTFKGISQLGFLGIFEVLTLVFGRKIRGA